MGMQACILSTIICSNGRIVDRASWGYFKPFGRILKHPGIFRMNAVGGIAARPAKSWYGDRLEASLESTSL